MLIDVDTLYIINAWRMAGDILNITCNFLYCNHQVYRDLLIILYNSAFIHIPLCIHSAKLCTKIWMWKMLNVED